MKVVLLSFWFTEYTIQLANAISETEQVILMLPRRFTEKYLKMVNKNIQLYLFHYPRLRYPTNLLMVYRIFNQIYKIKPDIIHLQAGHPWLILVFRFIKRRFPLVTTIHDVKPHYGDKGSKRAPLMDMVIRCSSLLIVHGDKLKEVLIKKFSIMNNIVEVIPHGELSIYRKFINKTVNEDKFSILFFGRIWEYKGLRYLIEAEPYISKQIPNLKIIIAGEGEDFSKYEKMMVHRERFIVYNKYINNEMLAELFQKASVVVLPYIDGSQSGVVAIAYAFKKPVVVTNVGSIPEVVIDGKTGYIVPSRDSKKLAEAVVNILKDDNLRKEMSENAYIMTKTKLSWKNIAMKTIQVYKKVLLRYENPPNK